ncbi:MAG: hypothetical protein KA170_03285 [Candidatus Promineofilum sp.]|nr:hypothetical protein [Promineifilum sp.]
MSFIPYAALWILLVAAAGICLLAGRRPRLPLAVCIAATLVAFSLWALFRPTGVTPALGFAGRQWAISDVCWSLTGVVLLLLLALASHALLRPDLSNSARHTALLLGTTAAALPVVWAADERTRIMGVTFFAVAWVFSRWYETGSASVGPRDRLGDSSRSWVAVFPLWAAAALPDGRLSLLLSMTGAAVLMGVWPFGGRRRGDGADLPGMPLNGLPVVVGAAVLAAALSATLPTAVELAAATAVGLLSSLVGLSRAWQQPAEIARSLGLGLAGLAFATALWVGPAVLPVATRLAVFAPLLMAMVSAGREMHSPEPGNTDAARNFQLPAGLIAVIVVFAAVIGLPLTAGWGTLGSLIETLRVAGGWVLLFVTLVLTTLWAATLYQIGRSLSRAGTSNRAEWLRALVFVPPIIGLLSLDFAATKTGPVTWAVILIPAVAGLLLGRFAPPVEAVADLLREAMTLPETPAATYSNRLGRAGQAASGALGDALAILEGESGLLWLLGLLLLLMWIA